MDDRLKSCPFCGAGETHIQSNKYWTGMNNIIISVDIRHWCESSSGIRGSSIVMRAKTENEAIEKWNERIV